MFASATFAPKASPKPTRLGRGPLHLSSMTCSASSLFHATSPFSNSSVCLAGRGLEQLVGRGRYVERLGVDEHVLDLDAERVEQAQRLLGARLYALFVAVLRPAGLSRRV